MIRTVIDTNVVLSGTYWTGDSRKILQKLEEGKIIAIASPEILKEYERILQHPDILEKIDELQVAQRAATLKLFQKMTIVEPKKKIKASKDPDDNKFIEVAVEGNVEFIISKDRDLLELRSYYGIKIVEPTEFLRKNRRKENV